MRTSLTHPLQISEVSAGPAFGRIGITFCPGKHQAAAATGPWARDIDLDLDAVAEWGAAAVVTLIEGHEIDSLKVERLPEAVRSRHMTWYHLPIPDVSTPCDRFEREWQEAGEQLRAILRSGFDILVHCKGGLGRAGTIAARLLIELGAQPAVAMAAVRAARPGAIETMGQQAFVESLAVVAEHRPETGRAAILDRAEGAILGLAVGDAIGTTLEFSARDSKPMLSDMVGGGPFNLQPGQWTDDTAMALALADSLIAKGRLDERDLMERFSQWHEQGVYSCTGSCFDIGITTRQAIARFKQTGDPVAGSTDPMTAGNGSLMRLAPVAIRFFTQPAQLVDAAARQSATTHGAAEAVDACTGYARMIAAAINGRSRSDVLSAADYHDRDNVTAAADAIDAILAGSWRGKPRAAIKSSGYVAHSLEAALWCVGRTGAFEDAVLLAANLGDDADTTAAITGQLAGALYGASAIPDRWRERVAWRPRLEATATRLATAPFDGAR